LKKLEPMGVGYNIIEKRLIGEKYEKLEKKMSIIEFLRRLRTKEPIDRAVMVVGFEDLLLTGKDTIDYVRRILSVSASQLRNHIIQLPVNGELILDREPKIRIGSREVGLTPIFGVKLEVKAPGYFYSPPNI